MARQIFLENQKFGKLLVGNFVGRDKYGDALYECTCDCGNVVVVRQHHLRSGHTTSCGCNKPQLDDLTGKRFGYLTVDDRADDYITPSNGKKYVRWNCTCDCGNKVTVNVSNLKSGSTISCGCQNPHALEDLTGQIFGSWKVLKQVDPYINPAGRRLIQYECECECGVRKNVTANLLRSGESLSCGCSKNLKGEILVADFLNERNILYEVHKSFADCLSDTGYRLNFDFYIPSKNILIECNGAQHYEPVEFFGGEEEFQKQQRHDELKRQYAAANGYFFLEIDCRKECLSDVPNILYNVFNNC